MFKNINTFLRTLVLGGLLVLGGWWTLFLNNKFADHEKAVVELETQLGESVEKIQALGVEVESLEAEVAAKELEIQRLDVALRLLKVDHRLARIEVLDQQPADDGSGETRTTVKFVELDTEGQPLGSGRTLVVEGKTLFVESLVVKFDDAYVEQGDALRGTSVCIFRRLFGEEQSPSEGAALDAAGLQPLAYTDDDGPNPLHEQIWNRFWEIANDPALGATLGVRAAQGEAPFIEAQPGKTYTIELRASGGLTIRPD